MGYVRFRAESCPSPDGDSAPTVDVHLLPGGANLRVGKFAGGTQLFSGLFSGRIGLF